MTLCDCSLYLDAGGWKADGKDLSIAGSACNEENIGRKAPDQC